MRRRLPSTLILGEAPAHDSYRPSRTKAAPWTVPAVGEGPDWNVRTTVTFKVDRATPALAIEAVQRTVARDVPEEARSRADFAVSIDVHQQREAEGLVLWTAVARVQWGSH